MKRFIRRTITVICLMACIAAAIFVDNFITQRSTMRRSEQAIVWIKTACTKPGVYPKLSLPVSLRSLTQDGTVTAFRLADGRIYFLAKTDIGFKENWSGFLHGSAPLNPSEMGQDYYGRAIILIDGLEGHFVQQTVNSRHFIAGFDLN